ncbi:MAG: DNA replication and repair protein RecF [Terrimicrobiaceae bacterium]|nr:DNA replication and repair protein RecF [Terrimicrobiaceae bacterium]
MPSGLQHVRLVDFRCFESLAFEPGPGRTFIVGRNAQGKTSILEAVCVLLRLQSPRTSSLSETVRMGQGGFSVDGHVGETHLTCQWIDGSRRILFDSKPQSRSDDYLETARVAWFSNSDLDLVRGGGSGRRRYLDFLGSQCVPGYRSALRAYERALRSRNALLKEGRPRREIEAFNEPLIEAGERIWAARTDLTTALAPLAGSAAAEISGAGDKLAITFQPGGTGPLAESLANSRPEEIRLRQTVTGPHRDDIDLHLNSLPAGPFASEGQQRSIALALKLAQARHLRDTLGQPPLFLIDDVFGELDPVRRNRLLSALPTDAQTLITTTFLDWAECTPSDTTFELNNRTLRAL